MTPESAGAPAEGARAPANAARPRAAGYDAIVIGGSAGGVDALLQLLPALPPGLQTSIFIVLHLPRTGSLLPEIFDPRCALPVTEALDKEPPAPGHVYVGPPDYHLLIDQGPVMALSMDEPVLFSRPAIDVLFESAADVYRNRLLGIVLSGGSADGAQGLAAIVEQGGDAVVQAPSSAAVPVMPEAALRACPQARALSPTQLAQFFASLP